MQALALLRTILLATFYCLLLRTPVDAREIQVVACDHITVLLKCPANSLIEIKSAFHGRKTNQYCDFGPRHNYNCDLGPRALTIAAARCNNRQSCHLTPSFFGDPCFGTVKHIVIKYTCKALTTAVACDEEVLSLQCPPGKHILIRDGFFGRASDEHCARGPRNDYHCVFPNFKKILADWCNNQERCSLSSRGLADPCRGTFKYMTASYECLDHRLSVACGDQRTSMVCSSHQTIRLLSSFVGRNTDEFCDYGPRLNYECSAPTATKLISDMCQGKPACSFYHDRLPMGDPCPGTHRTGIVKYRCA